MNISALPSSDDEEKSVSTLNAVAFMNNVSAVGAKLVQFNVVLNPKDFACTLYEFRITDTTPRYAAAVRVTKNVASDLDPGTAATVTIIRHPLTGTLETAEGRTY